MLSHAGAGHATRGDIIWAHEFFHKRATQQVWLPWHRSGLLPSSWAAMPSANTSAAAAADGACRVACKRRPPYFEELADAAPLRAEWRQALSGAVQKYSNGSITARVVQRAHASDLETLAAVYEQVRVRVRVRG